ncbi:DNA replication and repair protein RecF [Candidatus Berkelbacteria bacterium]|nr:DNA replication and repair protein RecF [Candidatus Berkelbacteria bacterium]
MAQFTLELTAFRRFQELQLDFKPISLILGPNGVGKSTLLEAVHYLSLGRSYRTLHDRELIGWESDTARARLELSELKIERVVSTFGQTFTKQAKHNGGLISALNSIGLFHVVLFSPELVELITGAPRGRRRYLDMILAGTDPTYTASLVGYQHALKQRNALLRALTEPNGRALEPWEILLAQEGRVLLKKRHALIDFLAARLGENYNRVAIDSRRSIILNYQSTISDPDRYEEHLLAARDRDRENRATTLGPHRDDMQFKVDGYEASVATSRGEQRSLLLALKETELEFVESKVRDDQIILLLDDMFSELDRARSEALEKLIPAHPVMITATDAAFISPALAKRAQIFELSFERKPAHVA